jgi:hypothetical protein
MQLKIKVTKEILEKAKYCGIEKGSVGTNCAIALAVREIFPDAFVAKWEILPFFNDELSPQEMELYAIKLPQKATEFISKFDNGSYWSRVKMEPIEFTVTVPKIVIDKINTEELKPIIEQSKTLELC